MRSLFHYGGTHGKGQKVTALYCRLSKDDGSNSESLSIRTQKSMLMEYATRNGFGNCQYYVDDGYSGTNSDRPAFQELLDDIREGKVATVITKDQSRLGRNHIETGTYMEIFFPEHGVRYIAINDGYDSNEQSQMDIAPFRNIINEMYAKDTSRKIKSALRTRKKSGKYISSGAPFGYQKDPADHNHLVIDPNTAPVVEYIYSMAEEGLGLHRIAKRLHDEKVLKPCYYKKEMFGRFIDDEKMYDWDSAYISQVLHSPVYAGHIIYEAKPTVSMKSKSGVIFHLKNALSFRIHMKQSSHKTVGRTCSESFTAVPVVLCAIRPTTTISSKASSAVQTAAERC